MQVSRSLVSPCPYAWAVLALIAFHSYCPARAADSEVAILQAAPWSPGDAVREGAGEFEVLFCVARLQHDHHTAGIVGIGNQNGLFSMGAERALRYVALRGVPVARLAQGGECVPDPDGLYLDAGHLSKAEAAVVLERCLDRLGAPPSAADPDHPTAGELAAIRAYLVPFREAFALAGAPRVASK